MKLITNTLADIVPVAKVPVGLNPVPKVIVKEEVPLVRIRTVHLVPAGGTVVVKVLLAVTVNLTTKFVAKAKARVSFGRAR
jgi:hypothetical protein